MNSEENEIARSGESEQPPRWLSEALFSVSEFVPFSYPEGAEEDPVFIERCREAATVAYGVAKLRKEQQRVGFVPLSFADYIQGLIRGSEVPLPKMLAQFGIRDLTDTNEGSVPALAKLAKAIGMGLRETLAHIGIGVASRLNATPSGLLVARYRGAVSRQRPLESCEEVLGMIGSEYALQSLMELRRIEASVRDVFNQEEGNLPA
jgi:hypothetical protein